MKKYTVPSWAGSPETLRESTFSLEVIKNGIQLDEIELAGNKSYFIIGRQPDIVDIPLENPSISRQHAVLQLRDDGALLCLDFGSAQGTFLNKSPLKKDTYQRVYVGDVLRFGTSPRLYVLKGPEEQRPPEYDSENLQRYRQEIQQKSAAISKKRAEVAHIGMWGFGEDAEEDDESDTMTGLSMHDSNVTSSGGVEEPDYIKRDPNYNRKFGSKFSANIDETEVHERDAELLSKLKAKELKIRNMQEENKRIYMKEGSQDSGLTEGQVAAVTRNDLRIEQLKEEIQQLVSDLKTKKRVREGGVMASSSRVGVKSLDPEAEEDAWLDCSIDNQDLNTNWRLRKKLSRFSNPSLNGLPCNSIEALSFEQLEDLTHSLSASISLLKQSIAECQAKIVSGRDSSAAALSDALAVSDELDEIMELESSRQAASALTHLQASLAKEELKLKQYSALRQAARPAISSLVARSSLTTSPSSSSSRGSSLTDIKSSSDLVCSSVLPSIAAVDSPFAFVADSDSSSTAEQSASAADATSPTDVNSSTDITSHPDDPSSSTQGSLRASVVESRADELSRSTVPFASDSHQKLKKPRIIGPILGTALLKTGDVKSSSHALGKSNVLQDGERVWVIPKGQSGDGKTSLNQKLGY